jgi:hypothetical protein
MVQRWFTRETTGLTHTHLLTTTDLVQYQCISKFYHNMMQQNILDAFCTIKPPIPSTWMYEHSANDVSK